MSKDLSIYIYYGMVRVRARRVRARVGLKAATTVRRMTPLSSMYRLFINKKSDEALSP